MQVIINNFNQFLSPNDVNELELKKQSHKNSSLNKDKIYFFRTSLFSEKSKNIIQRMNSSKKKLIKNNDDAIFRPKINPEARITINQENEKNEKKEIKIDKPTEKVVLLEEKNKIQKKEESPKNNNIDELNPSNYKSDVNIKVRDKSNSIIANNRYNFNTNIISNIDLLNKAIKQNNISKSTSHLMNINANNKYNSQMKNDNKSKTGNKNDKITNKENSQKISYKIINNMKRCKLFTTSNQINNINKNINNKSIIGNYTGKIQSIINKPLPNTNLNPILLSQKELTISKGNKKIKYKLKSIKNQTKEKNINLNNNNNNNLEASLKYLYNNNTIKKEMKYYKSISKHYNIQSFTILDENYHISRYKLGKYLSKRDNRYHNKNVVSEKKLNINLYKRNELNNNQFA